MVHKIRGKVVRGNSIGRKLGFPTANIPVAAEMPVQDGVYAAEVRVGGALYRAMVNIGTRPTVGDGAGRFAEANLFGFDGDIYGEPVVIFLLGYIRPERRFAGLDELRRQLADDRLAVIKYFNNVGL